DSTPGTVKPVPVSLVEPVAYHIQLDGQSSCSTGAAGGMGCFGNLLRERASGTPCCLRPRPELNLTHKNFRLPTAFRLGHHEYWMQFASYQTEGFYDEMFDPQGRPRAHARLL